MNVKVVLVALFSATVSAPSAVFAADVSQPLAAEARIQVSDQPQRFDLLGVDSEDRRLLGAHSEADALTVVDLKSNTLKSEVPVGESSGVAVDNKDGKYFVGTTKGIAVVDMDTFKKTFFIETPGPADAMVYDAESGKLYAGHDDGTELWVIEVKSDKLVGHIDIPGVPELLDADPATHRLYLNIKDKDELVVIDTHADKIVTTWATPRTHSPHGLALDLHGGRVFVAGQSDFVSVFSLDGKILGAIDIGPGRVDQIAYDDGNKRLYVPSSGRLVDVDVTGTGKVLGSVAIPRGTHSVAVDPQTHLVWIAYADKGRSYVQAYAPTSGVPH